MIGGMPKHFWSKDRRRSGARTWSKWSKDRRRSEYVGWSKDRRRSEYVGCGRLAITSRSDAISACARCRAGAGRTVEFPSAIAMSVHAVLAVQNARLARLIRASLRGRVNGPSDLVFPR
jgi:hypothetical protein